MDQLLLRAGPAGLALAPALGGAVLGYWWEDGGQHRDWLRLPAAGAVEPYQLSAFPLVPYSNRIRDGRFSFGGRSVQLPLNRPPEPHAIHGHGWQAAWQPVAVDETAAELEYRHPAGAWPWPYRARQRFVLAPERLTVELSLTNEGDSAMPAGLGWHPYFVRTPEATLSASVRGMWLTDAETMPTMLVAPVTPDPAAGLAVDRVPLDNCFVGWDHRARLEWPEWGAALVMTASPPLDCLVVFTPPGRPFFCAEPVSHVTDAINLAAGGRRDTGLRTLAPGESLGATMTLAPETDL
jgi:aldose 1-epimerase